LTGESAQQLVRATMARMGGYWRPLAAVARLLEELGELAESLASPDVPSAARGDDELASELADLWIITAALADQFLGEVAEPGARQASIHGGGRVARAPAAGGAQLGELIAAAGQIARIVNYYDGPKTPRSLVGWPSLNDAVAELHRTLAGVARAHDVELGAAVADKLRTIMVRDSERFAKAGHDPSTAPSLEQFRAIETTAWGRRIEQARLWGAPDWSAQSLAANVAAIVPTLSSFTRAALRERLDGYVITGPALESPALLGEWAQAVLGLLAKHDLRRERQASETPKDPGAQGMFTFNGMHMTVAIFSELYPHLLLQPSDVEHADEPR
jgi:NTP pyrophosphatase (non-canonical NTP hydrolase)